MKYPLPLLCLLTCILSALPSTTLAQVRILPLGDSITYRANKPFPQPNYRYELWKRLIDREFDFEYVGNLTDTYDPDGNTVYQDYEGLQFDRTNEGHRGNRYPEINAKLQDGRLNNYTADVALVFLGANDVRSNANFTVEQIVANARQTIQLLRGDNPNMTIFMGLIYNMGGKVSVSDLNVGISEMVAEEDSTQSRVVTVDFFNKGVGLSDGVHPSWSGGRRMAEIWEEALDDFGLFDGLTEPDRVPRDRRRARPPCLPKQPLRHAAHRRVCNAPFTWSVVGGSLPLGLSLAG